MLKYILLTLFILLSSVVIIFISCGTPTEHTTYWADFEGRVIDSLTRLPVDYAEVLCHPNDNVADTIAITDSLGIFKFTRVHIRSTLGTVDLTVTKSGYEPFKKTYKLTSLEYNVLPDILLFPLPKK